MNVVASIHAAHGDEPWLSKRQAAEHLGVSTRTIERWQKEGLPFRPVRGVNRYRRSEIAAWVETLDD